VRPNKERPLAAAASDEKKEDDEEPKQLTPFPEKNEAPRHVGG
jgi:hypothetical protein